MRHLQAKAGALGGGWAERRPIFTWRRRPALIVHTKTSARASLHRDQDARTGVTDGVLHEVAERILDQRRVSAETLRTFVDQVDAAPRRVGDGRESGYHALGDLSGAPVCCPG